MLSPVENPPWAAQMPPRRNLLPTIETPPRGQRIPNRQVPLPLTPARLPLLADAQRSIIVALMAQVLVESLIFLMYLKIYLEEEVIVHDHGSARAKIFALILK